MEPIQIVLIVLCCVCMAACVYLIITLKKITLLVSRLTGLVEANDKKIGEIVDHVNDITTGVSTSVDKVTGLVEKIPDQISGVPQLANQTKPQLGSGQTENLTAVLSVAGMVFSFFKFMQKRKQDKKVRELYKLMKHKR